MRMRLQRGTTLPPWDHPGCCRDNTDGSVDRDAVGGQTEQAALVDLAVGIDAAVGAAAVGEGPSIETPSLVVPKLNDL